MEKLKKNKNKNELVENYVSENNGDLFMLEARHKKRNQGIQLGAAAKINTTDLTK